MDDFRNSVAQQDVSVATETVVTSVVGENYYRVLYVTSAAIQPTMVTKASYEDAVPAIDGLSSAQQAELLSALATLFTYAADVVVYVISASSYAEYKYKAYFTYVEPSYNVDSESGKPGLTTNMTALLSAIRLDKEFSALFTDVAVPKDLAINGTNEQLTQTVGVLTAAINAIAEVTVFARGASAAYAFDEGVSPAMYQIGRTLGFMNSTGTPVGNSFDMTASVRANVVPTLDMSTDSVLGVDATVSTYFENNNICYWKPVGNGTAQITNYGASSLRGELVGVAWVRAYINYMTRVACAQEMTKMNTYKNAQLYTTCRQWMMTYVNQFVNLQRLENAQDTAPAWEEAKALSDGHTIVIPNAWEAYYVDNVRKAKISGTLYVAA